MSSSAPTVLVLASGRGERFRASGGQVHKLQALLAGRPVIEHTLAAVRASGLPWHLEDAGHPGMGDSIAAAVRATPGAAGWLILPADLPLVQPATLRRVAEALGDMSGGVPGVVSGAASDGPSGGAARAAQPRFQGRRGHPVGFAADCRDALADLKGNQGAAPVLKGLIAMNSVAFVDVDDVGVVTDIDTLGDLAAAGALLAMRTSAG